MDNEAVGGFHSYIVSVPFDFNYAIYSFLFSICREK